MYLFVLPHFFQKFLSAEVMSGLSCFFQQFFLHHALSSYTGVIGSRQEEGLISVHSFISDNRVFYSDGEGMSDMEISCHIGWREAHNKLFLFALIVSMEELVLLPPFIPILFYFIGVISLFHLFLIALYFDGLIKWQFLFFNFFLLHVRGLLFSADQFRSITGHQQSQHLVLLYHIYPNIIMLISFTSVLKYSTY